MTRGMTRIDMAIKALEQEPTPKDCRNCKKWDSCECGKVGHEKGISIGFSVGECKDYEPTPSKAQTIDYRRAFKIACELLNGSILYGVDADKIFEIMMDKDGVVASDSYEEYILNHLQELDQGQYVEVEE